MLSKNKFLFLLIGYVLCDTAAPKAKKKNDSYADYDAGNASTDKKTTERRKSNGYTPIEESSYSFTDSSDGGRTLSEDAFSSSHEAF